MPDRFQEMQNFQNFYRQMSSQMGFDPKADVSDVDRAMRQKSLEPFEATTAILSQLGYSSALNRLKIIKGGLAQFDNSGELASWTQETIYRLENEIDRLQDTISHMQTAIEIVRKESAYK